MCRPHLYLKSVSQATWQARLRVHFSFPLFVFRSTLFSQRSEEHTSELQSQSNLVCRLLLEKKKNIFSRSASRKRLNSVSRICTCSSPSISTTSISVTAPTAVPSSYSPYCRTSPI